MNVRHSISDPLLQIERTMKTAITLKLTTLAVVAMLAACGGGGFDSDGEANPHSETAGGNSDGNNSVTSTTSIGAITVNNLDTSGSSYREGQR